MGFITPKPDTSQQTAALAKQEEESKAQAERLARQTQEEFLAGRRGQRGRRSLIANVGGELGVNRKKLGG